MSIIDKTYFTLDANIPNSKWEVVTASITKYEPEILKKALGSTLYELMTADPTSSPYKEIVEGKDYTVEYNGETHTVKWAGLKNSAKISLIAYYVYYWWVRNHVTLTMYTGEMQPMQESSQEASTAMKVSNAWMRLKELYGSAANNDLEPTLYNFLSEHESSYPTWIFEELGSVNAWDL
jgi:hypothetical protein